MPTTDRLQIERTDPIDHPPSTILFQPLLLRRPRLVDRAFPLVEYVGRGRRGRRYWNIGEIILRDGIDSEDVCTVIPFSASSR